MGQFTQTALKSLGKAEYLSQSALTQLDEVSSLLTQTFSILPPKEGDEGPVRIDWTAVQTVHIDYLELVAREALETSQAYRAAKVAVTRALKRRDHLMTVLANRHRWMRMSFEATHGADSLALVGLDDPPARRIPEVREQCRDVVVRVSDPGLPGELGEPEDGRPPLDFEQLAKGMQDDLKLYEEAVDDLVEARKRRDAAFVTRNEAEKRLISTYANIARIQEGYFRLAGLDELADRIRLTIPRPPRPRDDQEPAPDAGDTVEP